jgi:hypothetical protein
MVNKKYINELRRNFFDISTDLEQKILKKFSDPNDYFTEQDIWEQVRKMISEDNSKGKLNHKDLPWE